MNIKEVEELLSIPRANIRYYEKEGLINPQRKNNNYRDYNEDDIIILKRIIILRKLGFTVQEISDMQNSDLDLNKAAHENILRLKSEIESLHGALAVTEKLKKENTDFENLDIHRYWDIINDKENNGETFADICKDYLHFELTLLDNMWKYNFFHNFKKSRQKHGLIYACLIILIFCIIKGIANKFIWQNGSFSEGFLYPFELFAIASLILLPIFILSKKHPKAASALSSVLLIISISILAMIFFGVIALLIYSFIRHH